MLLVKLAGTVLIYYFLRCDTKAFQGDSGSDLNFIKQLIT